MAKKPQIFAHRGARTVAPENTLPAFEKALEMNVDGIELDVQATRDGHLVLLHDSALDRTTTGQGLLRDRTLAELESVDAGIKHSEAFAGTAIPTLDQLFDLVGDSCLVNIEIKNKDWDGGPEVELLVRLIQRRKLHGQIIVSSFNPISLIAMRWHDPSIPIGLLYDTTLPVFLRRAWLGPFIAPEALHPGHALIDREYVRWAHSQGHYVNTWTVNEVEEARRLAGLGVDVIISDVPDQIMDGLAQEDADWRDAIDT